MFKVINVPMLDDLKEYCERLAGGGNMKLQLRLNANHLKLIAIITMTIDHVCDLIYLGFPTEPGAMALHIVGRLTAPIMWFFVCEGYYYMHNVKRYMLRMGF